MGNIIKGPLIKRRYKDEGCKIAEGIHMLTVNMENILFEGMWEIGNGVTLNSYLVKEKKLPLLME